MSNKWKFRAAYAALYIGSAVFCGYVAGQAFDKPAKAQAVKVDSGATDARLVAQAWAGAVETGDVQLACRFADGAVKQLSDADGAVGTVRRGEGRVQDRPCHPTWRCVGGEGCTGYG